MSLTSAAGENQTPSVRTTRSIDPEPRGLDDMIALEPLGSGFTLPAPRNDGVLLGSAVVVRVPLTGWGGAMPSNAKDPGFRRGPALRRC